MPDSNCWLTLCAEFQLCQSSSAVLDSAYRHRPRLGSTGDICQSICCNLAGSGPLRLPLHRQLLGDAPAVRPPGEAPQRAQVHLDRGRFPLVAAQTGCEALYFPLRQIQLLFHMKAPKSQIGSIVTAAGRAVSNLLKSAAFFVRFREAAPAAWQGVSREPPGAAYSRHPPP